MNVFIIFGYNKKTSKEEIFDESLAKEENDQVNQIDELQEDELDSNKENLQNEDEVLTEKQIDSLLMQTTDEKEEKMKEEVEIEQKEINDNNNISNTNEFLEIWEKYMKDFLPEDVINLKIAPWQQEVLIENLESKFVPAYFRGAYLVYSEADDDDIDFTIQDPNGEQIWQNDKNKQGMFFFNATIPGKYEFKLNNKKFLKEKQVTFAFHNGKVISEDAYKQKSNPMIDSIQNSMIKLRDIMILSKMIAKRQDTHYASIIKTHRKIFAFTLFETLAIVFSSIFAIYYIKKLLDNKIIV